MTHSHGDNKLGRPSLNEPGGHFLSMLLFDEPFLPRDGSDPAGNWLTLLALICENMVRSDNMTRQVEAAEIEAPFTPLPENEFKQALIAVAPHLRAFARALCGSADRADDLAQETMLKAWAARDRYRAGTNFKAWTFTILRNQFYSETRRNRFRGEYDETMAERILYTPGSQESVLELADVLRALEAIPGGYREALILVSVEGMSYEEAAEVCQIAVGTVKSRVSRARAMLSNIMASGALPDFRHNFVLKGESIDIFFDELLRIANHDSQERRAA